MENLIRSPSIKYLLPAQFHTDELSYVPISLSNNISNKSLSSGNTGLISVVILLPLLPQHSHVLSYNGTLQFSHQYISDFSSSVLSPQTGQTLLFVLMLSFVHIYLSNISSPVFIMLFKRFR